MEGKGIRLRHIEQVSILEHGLHTAAGNAHDEIRTPACRGRDGFQRHVRGIDAGSGAGCVLQEGIETDRFLCRQGRGGRGLGQGFRSPLRQGHELPVHQVGKGLPVIGRETAQLLEKAQLLLGEYRIFLRHPLHILEEKVGVHLQGRDQPA